MDSKTEALLKGLRGFLPGKQIYTDLLRRFAWGTDGSFYRLTPQVVVRAANTVTLQPGVVGAEVNRFLAPFGRHFGPDPASIGSCAHRRMAFPPVIPIAGPVKSDWRPIAACLTFPSSIWSTPILAL